MIELDEHLKIDTCPHCSVDYPNMIVEYAFKTSYDNGKEPKIWRVYICKRCGGSVLAMGYPPGNQVSKIYPNAETPDINLPDNVRTYLGEAMRSTSTPIASVIVSASAVDAMLKEKGYKDGSLYIRIEKAIVDHLLTPEMGEWAHQVRLGANGQRHADENVGFPTIADAKMSLEFAKTLGEFLFVLPAKVKRGIANSDPATKPKATKVIQPKEIKLPSAYRNASKYSHVIELDDSETVPDVTAKFYNTRSGPLLPEVQQPSNLKVKSRSGNPRWWETELTITNPKNLPERFFIEILVDGQVYCVADLSVNNRAN
ncbi:DUF4145 domain-containing protein [Spirosoma areae]